jgi:hypothetical protein
MGKIINSNTPIKVPTVPGILGTKPLPNPKENKCIGFSSIFIGAFILTNLSIN